MVDNTGAADTGVETGQEKPPAEQPPPPDRPGAEGAPSRADSRTAAANGPATDQAADGSQSGPSAVATRELQNSSQESAPEHEETESPEHDTRPAESAEPTDGKPKQAEAKVGQETDEGPATVEVADDRTQQVFDQGKVAAISAESAEGSGEGTAALESGDQSERGRVEDAGVDSPSTETDPSADSSEADQTAPSESDGATAEESTQGPDIQDPAEAPLGGDAEDAPDHLEPSEETDASVEIDGQDQLPDDEHLDDATDDAGPAPNDAEDTSGPEEDAGRSPDIKPEVEPDRHGERTEAVEPLTDAEYVEHVREVADKLDGAHAQGRATDQAHTVDQHRNIWSDERDQIHDEIIDALYARAADVPDDRNAVIAGGLGGAGKSTVLGSHAGIDQTQYLTINPDDIKEEMARRDLIPAVEGLSPMEASDLVHEESSHIAKRLASRAQADGMNVIWDITMSSPESTEKRIDALREAGYRRIDGVFVDIPVETSVQRAQGRHRRGHEAYRNGKGEGGRYVPDEVIRANKDPERGSVNRRTFEQVKDRFDAWSIYDNSVDGRAPVLLDSSEKEDETA